MDKAQVFKTIQKARPLPDANTISMIPVNILGAYLIGATIGSANTYIYGVKFRDAQYDTAKFNLVIPAGWSGRGINLRYSWGTPNTNSGNVMWVMEILKIEEGVAIPTSVLLSPSEVVAAPLAIHTPVYGQLSDTLTGFQDGDTICLQLVRYGSNGNDTYTSDAWVYSAIISVG